ncbi:hypothetical protein [Streptomyces griseorubiginosus]|uniref:hypothetical protein n=1 Tax=Streptomyces griseorubiginosus TaxID=67304 RepID=UPI003647129F
MSPGSPARLGDLLRTARALRVSDPDDLATLATTLGFTLPSRPSGDQDPSTAANVTAPDGGSRRPANAARPSRGDRTTARANGSDPTERPSTGSSPPDTARRPGREGTAPPPYRHDPAASPTAPDEHPPASRTVTSGSLLLIRAGRPPTARETQPPVWREFAPTDSPADGTEQLLGRADEFDMPWPTALPRPAPPWNPRTERALFLAVAGTFTTGRAVDHPRLVELVVRGLAGGPVARPRVPYRRRLTTRAGALLLLDRGESMRPFRHDQEWIARLAARILPPGGLRVLDLRIAQGVSRDRGRTWEPHPVPPHGQPVLLLSDLGHLQPPLPGRHHSSPKSWLPYLRRLRESGCRAVCLTPYPAEEYPAAVRRTVALVPLDRRVSVRLAQTIARREPGRAGQPR